MIWLGAGKQSGSHALSNMEIMHCQALELFGQKRTSGPHTSFPLPPGRLPVAFPCPSHTVPALPEPSLPWPSPSAAVRLPSLSGPPAAVSPPCVPPLSARPAAFPVPWPGVPVSNGPPVRSLNLWTYSSRALISLLRSSEGSVFAGGQ